MDYRERERGRELLFISYCLICCSQEMNRQPSIANRHIGVERTRGNAEPLSSQLRLLMLSFILRLPISTPSLHLLRRLPIPFSSNTARMLPIAAIALVSLSSIAFLSFLFFLWMLHAANVAVVCASPPTLAPDGNDQSINSVFRLQAVR